jgi:hypothetical protein
MLNKLHVQYVCWIIIIIVVLVVVLVGVVLVVSISSPANDFCLAFIFYFTKNNGIIFLLTEIVSS